MDTDQLIIELEINEDGQLQPTDKTNYNALSCSSESGTTSVASCHHHSVVEVVTGPDNFTFERWRYIDPNVGHDDPAAFYSEEEPIDLGNDGVYLYYKALIPWEDHNGNDAFYCVAGENKIIDRTTGKQVSFLDFWGKRDQSNNVFSNSEQMFVTMTDLIKCFVLTERDRLNEALKKGCDLTCKESALGLKANLLAVIVFLMWHYIYKEKNFEKAKTLLDRIQVCNGLCNTVKKHIKSCGCYEGDI